MFLRPPLRLPLLMLLALAPLAVADREELTAPVTVRQGFDAPAPYLEGPNKAAANAVAEQCQMLNRKCIAFSSVHPDVVLAAVPDSPKFWAAYSTFLAADPLPVEHLDPENLPLYQGFIDATKGWLWRELVTKRMADAARLHEQVRAHRRRLAMSNLLIDKMIFLATTSIVLPAINVHMAHRDQPVTAVGRELLDDMLNPLVRNELSLRRALEGELWYAAARLEEQRVENRSLQLVVIERLYGFVAERSEAGWQDFWSHGLDVLANVEAPSEYWYTTSLAHHAVNVRYLEASLIVLRSLRGMYEGRISPGPPATPAPYGWNWRWEEDSETLCLDPGYLHASVDRAESICHQYLMTSDS